MFVHHMNPGGRNCTAAADCGASTDIKMARKATDLLGALVSMTRASKACRTGVAVDVVDVWQMECQSWVFQQLWEGWSCSVLTMSPNLYRKVAARFDQNARSSEPGGWKSIAGGPPEDIRLEGR